MDIQQWKRHMAEVLSLLPDDGTLVRNQVGNLSILQGGEFVGYIDVLSPLESDLD